MGDSVPAIHVLCATDYNMSRNSISEVFLQFPINVRFSLKWFKTHFSPFSLINTTLSELMMYSDFSAPMLMMNLLSSQIQPILKISHDYSMLFIRFVVNWL